MLGPYFTFGGVYFIVTLSFIFAYVFYVPMFLFSAGLTSALCLVLFKLVHFLSATKSKDKIAQETYEQELQDAAGAGCVAWCNSKWAKLWCANAVLGLPRFVRSQVSGCMYV